MTPEAMRIAIAESEGWKWVFFPEMDGGSYGWVKDDCFPQNAESPPFPNYPEDCNAILPLLPVGTKLAYANVDCWFITIGSIRVANKNLALAASEFYLRWSGKWEDK